MGSRARRYTHNTVAIDVHLSLLLCVLVWAMVWALYAGLTIGDYTLLLYPRTGQSEMISSALSTALLYGTTSFFEMLLLLLLVTNDIGRNTLQTAGRFAAAWGVAARGATSAVLLYVTEQQRSGSPTAAPT